MRDLDRYDLVFESAGCLRFGRLSVRVECKIVLLLAGDLVFLSDDLARVAHMPVLERAPKPVMDHKVGRRLVAHAKAFACRLQGIWNVGHRFHPAGNHVFGITELHRLRCKRDGTQPRTANHVDGQRRNFGRKTGLQSGLPRGCLADARLHDAAHYHFIYLRRVNAGAFYRFFDREGAELRGRKTL